MRYKLQPGLLLALVVVLCACLIAGIVWLRSRTAATAQALVSYLPNRDTSVTLFIDFTALRQSGLLAAFSGSKVTEEPEYKAFVLETAFDYAQDLDLAVVSFQPQAVLFLLRGRFDWPRLRAYAKRQNGNCHNTFCRLPGSTPERNISFFPLSNDVMAMAVSGDGSAAGNLMTRIQASGEPPLPRHPVWLSIPGSYLRSTEKFPAGTRLFAKAMEKADRVVLSLVSNNGGVEALLEAGCRTAGDASSVAGELQALTGVLREMIAKEKQTPNPKDLSGVLTAGAFRVERLRVLGRWPLPRPFLETLAGGSP